MDLRKEWTVCKDMLRESRELAMMGLEVSVLVRKARPGCGELPQILESQKFLSCLCQACCMNR